MLTALEREIAKAETSNPDVRGRAIIRLVACATFYKMYADAHQSSANVEMYTRGYEIYTDVAAILGRFVDVNSYEILVGKAVQDYSRAHASKREAFHLLRNCQEVSNPSKAASFVEELLLD